MSLIASERTQQVEPSSKAMDGSTVQSRVPAILSFDVEEHFRIEAAAGLALDSAIREHSCDRLVPTTHWILDQLDRTGVKATFFVVGQIAVQNPAIVRDIARAGHEVASHGWDHQRVHRFTPGSFRADVMMSRDALEQVTGGPVRGFRAPTFSVVRETAWAIDVLADLGFAYDSSIYPVRHDRYGVPKAPRTPFMARGHSESILELPPATLRILGLNVPMGGGGYFRLFPLFLTKWALRQMRRHQGPGTGSLYFHPWEFDPDQSRLPLSRMNRFRTYVGIRRTRGRLVELLESLPFARAIDVARGLENHRRTLPSFGLVN